MAFFARKSMWDSTVSYWSPSVASFVAFLCVCTCGHAASLQFFFAKMALGRARWVATVAISCCSCLLQLQGVFRHL